MDNKLCSIIIPCYNVDAYLSEALASVQNQTLAVLEIVLVDDGSTVPLSIPVEWRGPPIKLIRTTNCGLPAARNRGIRSSVGELVGFLDADDLWLPGKVEAQTQALTANPEAVACYTRCIGDVGFYGFGPYPPSDVSDDEFLLVLWYNLFFPPSAVVVRRSALEAVGGFREDLGNGEDIEMWLRLLRKGQFIQVPEPLTGYRRHNQQFTKNLVRKLLGSKQSRATMIAQHSDRLIQAGLPRQKLWDAYRNDILCTYYRRQFDAARRLLFDFWWDHPSDLPILLRAVIALLPGEIVSRLRGEIPKEQSNAEIKKTNADWELAVQRVRHAIGR